MTRTLFVAALLGAATPALGGPGDGVRFGGSEGRLHPFVELEGRYDSNVFVNTAGSQGAADAILHFRPGVTLAVPGETTSVDFYGLIDWAQYLGTKDSATKDLSHLNAEARLDVAANRRGAVGVELTNLFRRSEQPEALSIGAGVISNYNALELRLPYHPGGGALTTTVTGLWSIETYEPFLKGFTCSASTSRFCDASQLAKLGYNQLGAAGDVRWRFLPRTSALLEAAYFKRLPNDSSVGSDSGGYRVATGVTGLITPHVAATLKAGYGGTAGGAISLGTWLAVAEGEWLPTETASVKLGYSHDFAVDPQVVYALDRVALDARYLLGGRLTLKAHAGWDHLDFAGAAAGSATTDIVIVSPAVAYEVARWMRAEVAYAYTDRTTHNPPATPLAPLLGANYTKNEGWLRLAFTY